MFVRAIKDFETPTHNVRAGQIVDLPNEQASDAIKRGDATTSSVEAAIADMSTAQRATTGPDAKHIKRAS